MASLPAVTSSRDDPVAFLDPLIYSAETLDGATHGGSAHGTTNFGPLCHAFLSQWQDLVAIRGVIATFALSVAISIIFATQIILWP